MKKISRRAFLSTLGGVGISAISYGFLIEPRWLAVDRFTIPLTGMNSGARVRILHLSDLHLSSMVPLSYIRSALQEGLAAQPDLICITGDFITHALQEAGRYREALSLLSRAAPTFASLGNHDGGRWAASRGSYADSRQVEALLADSGIQCLVNGHRRVFIRGQHIDIIGLGDLWAGAFDAPRAFAAVEASAAALRIVLSHNPDTKEMLWPFPWDIQLSGHTHGGQIRVPFLGAPFAPVKDRRFVEGLHRWEGRWLYITRGVGNVRGVRFNCRPQVSILELVAAQ